MNDYNVVISKMPIIDLVVIFIFYLITHIAIAFLEKKSLQDYQKDLNTEKLNYYNKIRLLNKWYPAIALIFIIMILY